MRKFRMPDLDITGTWVVAVGVFFPSHCPSGA